jgi:hypothetical protein
VTGDVAGDDADECATVGRRDEGDLACPQVLVARRGQLLVARQVDPQLEAMEQSASDNEPFRRLLDVQDASAGGHPLRVAVGDHPAPTVGIGVLEDAVDHVGDGLEAAVWMPRGALRLARRVFDLAHLVEVDEWVEVGQIDAGERATDREALPFETARGAGDAADRALPGDGGVGLRDPRQDGDVFDDDGWHGAWTPLSVGSIAAR